MAVPFNMPEENNELGLIIYQFQSLLTQLQVALRQHPGFLLAPASIPTTRVRTSPSQGTEMHSSNQSNQNDTAQLLDWLTEISQENRNASSSQLTMIPPRYRTISESCEETKINITTIVNADSIQDWAHIGVALRKLADNFSPVRTLEEDLLSSSGRPSSSSSSSSSSSKEEGILSKLPDTLTGSIWTAMLCCVGWHLFRAR